jgi:hypothetical protein
MSPPIGAGADDVHVRRLPFAFLAEALQALCRSEHADEVGAVGVDSSDGIDAGSPGGGQQRVAVVLGEELEDRVVAPG